MNERLFWIDIHYATFGIVSINNTIIETAHINAWMKGKTLQEIKPWLINKNAKVVECCLKPK